MRLVFKKTGSDWLTILTNETASILKPKKKFKKINIRLEESKNFINEPSKLILQELSSKIEHQKEQSDNVLGKLIKLTNRTGQDSANNPDGPMWTTLCGCHGRSTLNPHRAARRSKNIIRINFNLSTS